MWTWKDRTVWKRFHKVSIIVELIARININVNNILFNIIVYFSAQTLYRAYSCLLYANFASAIMTYKVHSNMKMSWSVVLLSAFYNTAGCQTEQNTIIIHRLICQHQWKRSESKTKRYFCCFYCFTSVLKSPPMVCDISTFPLPWVWQWNRHYLFQRLCFAVTGIRTPVLTPARRRL